MDEIRFESQEATSSLNQQPVIYSQSNQTMSISHQGDHTTLQDIGYYELDDDEDDNDQIVLEDGEMDTSKLSILNPLYKDIKPSKSDKFYLQFFSCLEGLQGEEKIRYDLMKDRFKKFFIQKDGLQRGQRWNKRIQPNYDIPSVFPLSYAIMLYGVDLLSNRDIKKVLKLPKQFKNIKRINWSNAAVIFKNKQQLDAALKPHLFDNETYPFLEPKQEQDSPSQMPKKLPKNWYGLRPYEHKDEYIFWFVRYLTNLEPELLYSIKDTAEFMETYNASKKMWEKKQKQRMDMSSIMNTSRFQTIDRSQKQRSVHLGSEPERRQRSRQKLSNGVVSQKFARSDVFSEIGSKIGKQNTVLEQSYDDEMSFVYAPKNNIQLDAQLKKKSDEIIMLMECLHVGTPRATLQNMRNGDILDLDDDMAIISDHYDPKGLSDCFFFEKRNKISQLTELKPDEKFNYNEYVERILEAEEENKQKKTIPVIFID